MKKLLKILRSKWFITILAVLLVLIFTLAMVKGAQSSEEKRITAYDYHYYNSFRDGMPDYGLRKRKNILPQF